MTRHTATKRAPPRKPAIEPPGTVRSATPGHGMANPIGGLTPLDELRQTLSLSSEVRVDEVCRTAVAEIARLREGSSEPAPWVDEPDDAPIRREAVAQL